MGINKNLIKTLQAIEKSDAKANSIGVENNNNDKLIVSALEEGNNLITKEHAEQYNHNIIIGYKDEFKRLKHYLLNFNKDVFNYKNSYENWQLLNRQLTQCKAALRSKLIEDRKGGYIIDNIPNGVIEAYNEFILNTAGLLHTIDLYLEVVSQQLEKHQQIHINSFVDRLTFEPMLILALWQEFNEEIFHNTVPEFYAALNDPENEDFKVNFTGTTDKLRNHFISQLAITQNQLLFPNQFCKKQNIDIGMFNKKRHDLQQCNAKKDTDYIARFNRIFNIKKKVG